MIAYGDPNYYEDDNAIYFVTNEVSSNIFFIPKFKLYLRKSTAPDPFGRRNYQTGMEFSTNILSQEELYQHRPDWNGFSLTPYRVSLKESCVFNGVLSGVYDDVIEISNTTGRDIGAGDGVDPCSFLFGIVAKYEQTVKEQLDEMVLNKTLIEINSSFIINLANSKTLNLSIVHSAINQSIPDIDLNIKEANFYLGVLSERTPEVKSVLDELDNDSIKTYIELSNQEIFQPSSEGKVTLTESTDAIFEYDDPVSEEIQFSLFE